MNPRFLACTVALAAILSTAGPASAERRSPKIKQIDLTPGGKEYVRLLEGPPETHRMKSGLVTLTPGKSVGKHSTEQFEELLVVLEGQGEMTLSSGSKLPFKAPHALYCPPATEHDVTNTGKGPLRYVFVVVKTR